MTRFVVALALLVALPNLAIAQGQRRVRAELTPIVESDTPQGASVRLAVLVRVPDGYHVQSNAPRDPDLIPTTLSFDPPSGLSITEVVFPKPSEFTLVGSTTPLAVFEREFAIGVQVQVDAMAGTGAIDLPARLRYQACDDKFCYAPTTADVSWTLNIVPKGARVTPRETALFSTIAFGTGGPPPPSITIERKPPTPSSSPAASGGAALDDFTVAATTGGYLRTAEFLTFIHDAESGVTQRGMFEGRGPFAIMLLVLLGGLALNLTPCVLPMIPINLAVIGAGTKAGSRGRGFLLGGVYGVAMAMVYGVLGVIVVVTAGTFGTINSSPWFNAAIAIVFVLLALAMFDVFTIDFSRFSSSVATVGHRGSLALAFGMGAIAALLAGACVAPVVIQVVLFSSNLYAKGTSIALALPFLLGVGMAIPWPIAGAGLSALPKPGAWMVRVKQVFGVVILATAAYYGYLAYELVSDRWVDAKQVTSSVDAMVKEGWHSSLDEGLAVARRENKPVLVDMWATWCKNCLTMDQTTLKDGEVKAALEGYVKVKYQAEQPDEQPARAVMERFRAVGLPTYVILHPAK